MSTIGKQVIHSVRECPKAITDQSRAVPHLLDIWRRRWTRQYDANGLSQDALSRDGSHRAPPAHRDHTPATAAPGAPTGTSEPIEASAPLTSLAVDPVDPVPPVMPDVTEKPARATVVRIATPT
jgi:hypothetical protein